MTGWLGHRLSVVERLLAAVAALVLIAAMPMTDEIGFALFAGFIALWWFMGRRG